MIASIQLPNFLIEVDLSKPIDISIPLISGEQNLSAWYVNPPLFKAVESEYFIGDVNRGGAVNFKDIYFNPHGHGTHTECVGHISKEFQSINKTLKNFFTLAQVISINPEISAEDRIVRIKQISENILPGVDALIIRTLPNNNAKTNFQYSNTNPPYLETGTGKMLRERGIKHLLIDTPSIDKEFDEGKLVNHHEFWNYPQEINNGNTITEFIFVPDSVEDGYYLLNLQIAPFENDASPSKPILFKPLNNI